MAIKAGIVGAAGFAGAELARLIMGHPRFDLHVLTSDALAGERLSAAYPAFMEAGDLSFAAHDEACLEECEAVFLAVPHTAALGMVPPLIEQGKAVFDLSADYRLKDPAQYEAWYSMPHTSPELLHRAAFGLPEIFGEELAFAAAMRAEGKATLVACAGCYPTATSLAAYPAVSAGLVTGPVVADAISGVTGAGKKASERTHFCFASDSLEAYGGGKHRHTPEIEQILGLPGQVIFTPHLAPLNRGLLSTVYLPLADGACNLSSLHERYRSFYRDSSFVFVLDQGEMPRTDAVAGTNCAHIGLIAHEAIGVLVAVCAIDNLCKGAAGQALQCANIVFGLPEDEGLPRIALPI